jgi:hypothetical protein
MIYLPIIAGGATTPPQYEVTASVKIVADSGLVTYNQHVSELSSRTKQSR